ncbi:MAG: S41 family peptidase [Bacteroidales bacterium]|nr:S41 family peptidase [Bacteroidales bacterium]
MKRILLPFIALATLALASTAASYSPQSASQREFTSADKLRYAFAIIESFYVDSVPSGQLVEDGIKAMLKDLDPHSSYSDASETKEMTEKLDGGFSGIGIQFNMLQDTLFVIQTTAGGPSEAVGILAGDKIIAANDTAIAGVKMKNSEVIKHLRGPKGTTVDLKVLRRGVAEPIHFRVTRDDIPIYSIDAAYMAAPGIGYIRVARFGENTYDEFSKALDDLKKKGAVDLIIDLQDNGGGYMGPAPKIAERFLEYGDPIVSTRGRVTAPTSFTAERTGDWRDGRVVVLVNQYSASAAEILSGALQDNDRALIVGRRTFGKGLVQRPMPFPDGSMIRLTTSRYYTPSGRCIQKPYTKGDDEAYNHDMRDRFDSGELMHLDSIRLDSTEVYQTLRLHRPVYGGGGIMPDRFVPLDTAFYTPYYRDLVAKGVINQYCIKYVDDNRKALKKQYPTVEKFIDNFEVTPELMQGLIAKASSDVEYNDEQYQISRPTLEAIVKAMIGRDLFDTPAYFQIYNPQNPIYLEGLRLLQSPAEFDALLHP